MNPLSSILTGPIAVLPFLGVEPEYLRIAEGTVFYKEFQGRGGPSAGYWEKVLTRFKTEGLA